MERSPIRELRRRGLAFHVVSMAVGMAMFFCAVSFVGSVKASIDDAIGALGTNVLVVMDRTRAYGEGADEQPELDWSLYESMQRQLSHSHYIAPVLQFFAEAEDAQQRTTLVNVWATTDELYTLAGLDIASGRRPTAAEMREGNWVCVVGADLEAARSRGATERTWLLDSRRCRITGVLATPQLPPGFTLRRTVLVPITSLRIPGARPKMPLTQIYLRSRRGEQTDSARAALVRLLETRGVEHAEVWSAEDFWKARRRIAAQLGALSMGIATLVITLAAAALGGGLLRDVQSRRAEIGLRIALGATRASIFRLMLVDGMAVAAVGGVVGVLTGVLAIAFVLKPLARGSSEFQFDLSLTVTPAALVVTVGVLTVVAVASSCWPARDAANTDPSLALRGLMQPARGPPI